MYDIEVIEVNRERKSVVVRAGNIYLEFQKFFSGRLKMIGKWKYTQVNDNNLYINPEEFLKALQIVTAILKDCKYQDRHQQLSLDF